MIKIHARYNDRQEQALREYIDEIAVYNTQSIKLIYDANYTYVEHSANEIVGARFFDKVQDIMLDNK